MAGNPSWGPNSICITAAFTPGSISLSAFELSVAGFEWGRKIQDVMANPVVSSERHTTVMSEEGLMFISLPLGFQHFDGPSSPTLALRPYPRSHPCPRRSSLELLGRSDTTVRPEHALCLDARRSTRILGGRTSTRTVLELCDDGEWRGFGVGRYASECAWSAGSQAGQANQNQKPKTKNRFPPFVSPFYDV
jgi:hypothetical protein